MNLMHEHIWDLNIKRDDMYDHYKILPMQYTKILFMSKN